MLLPGILFAVFLAGCGAVAWLVARRRYPDPPPAGPAEAALARHPAGRWRTRQGQAPVGPDDDPEFLSRLARRIHGGPAE